MFGLKDANEMKEAEFGKTTKEICKYVEFVEYFADFEMVKAEMERLIEDRK